VLCESVETAIFTPRCRRAPRIVGRQVQPVGTGIDLEKTAVQPRMLNDSVRIDAIARAVSAAAESECEATRSVAVKYRQNEHNPVPAGTPSPIPKHANSYRRSDTRSQMNTQEAETSLRARFSFSLMGWWQGLLLDRV
jgi:hypothetical protein